MSASPGDCVVWTGARQSRGYGSVSVAGKTFLVHRLAYEAARGEIPPGLTIDHLCRNKLCINPEHMEVVTRAENARRALLHAPARPLRTHCRRGHAFTPANTYRTPSGDRECRTCRRARAAQAVAA